MSDRTYFMLLAVTVTCAVIVPIAAKRITKGDGGPIACLAMATGCVVGTLATMPFGNTEEMPWFPELAVGYFGIAFTATVLLGVSRTANMGRQTSMKPEDTENQRLP